MDLLKQELGQSKFAATETRFCCPFCGEHKYKFYVHNDSGLWICFKCEEKGNPISFVTEYFNVSFPEAIDILATYDYDANLKGPERNQQSLTHYGADLSEEEQLFLFIAHQGQPVNEQENKMYKCPPPPTNCKSLMANFDNPEAFPFFAYLNNRGVTIENIKEHNISYVTYGTTKLQDGRDLELVNHVVFFTFDDKRNPIYWNTRSIESNAFIKSFNAPAREDEYSKNNVVFNLNNAYSTDKIVVAEGVFNALTIGKSGVATFGKMVTEDQIRLILQKTRNNKLPIYLYLDTDAWKQMIAAADRIKALEPDRTVYYVYNGREDVDANDLGPEAVQELIANAFIADSTGEMKLRMMNL